GLKVWFDENEISDFASITNSIEKGLAQSKALLAYYSSNYPYRRACQWELTAAFIAGQLEGDPRRRVLVINPELRMEHIHPLELRDQKLPVLSPSNRKKLAPLAAAVRDHIANLSGPLGNVHSLKRPQWYGICGFGSQR